MRRWQFLISIIAALPLVLVVGFFSVPAVATAASMAPQFCHTDTPIPANDIASPLDLRTCPIQGRELFLRTANGQHVAGLHVPAAGHGIGNITLTTTGEYKLTAYNNNGYLKVTDSYPATTIAASSDPACSETAYNLEGPFWGSTYKWYINESTITNRTNLNLSSTITNIRQGNTNMTTGVNNCGYSGEFGAYGAFQGNTSRYANINSSGNCTSKFPDGQNTVSFGSFNSGLSDLAVTCYTWNGAPVQLMDEADIYFGSNVGIVNSFPSNCTWSFDLQTVATHEWGHVFGLAHETSGTHEVMYPYVQPCHLRRHLGNGDWHGMAHLYGFR